MSQRVATRNGNKNLLLVCPHGFDDTNTDIITEELASSLDCFSLINYGWERTRKPDDVKGWADCNNSKHVMDKNSVVFAEFGKPFIQMRAKIYKFNKSFYTLYIHGCGSRVRKVTKDPDLGMIIGFGQGTTPSLTCEKWMAEVLAIHATANNIKTYLGKADGDYAAWLQNNMCQYYRKKRPEPLIHSMQLEIVSALRKDSNCKATATLLAKAIDELLKLDIKGGDPNAGKQLNIPEC